jgi:hypothetical protein
MHIEIVYYNYAHFNTPCPFTHVLIPQPSAPILNVLGFFFISDQGKPIYEHFSLLRFGNTFNTSPCEATVYQKRLCQSQLV